MVLTLKTNLFSIGLSFHLQEETNVNGDMANKACSEIPTVG